MGGWVGGGVDWRWEWVSGGVARGGIGLALLWMNIQKERFIKSYCGKQAK